MNRRLATACLALALVAPVAAYASTIQLVPASLSYSLISSDPSPSPATITVNNTGTDSLAWMAAENPDVPWLSISPTTGSNGTTFTVTIDKTGLTAGSYTATVRVSDPAATNSPQDLSVTMLIRDVDANVTTANSYDDAWQDGPTGWAATMRAVRAGRPAGLTATSGFCVFLGDSITYSGAFGAWARSGGGKTSSDAAICNWSHANTGSSQNTNDGWYLAKYDVPGRNGSYTARSGITASQYLDGTKNLPSMDQMYTAGFTNPDGKQYRDAQIAVILLGTNDLASYTDTQLAANLSTIVDKLQANGIIPVLTTIPPRSGQDAKVLTFVTAVRDLAQTRKLPLIDFYQEIMRRRPGQTWFNTLISSDGVHPTGDRAGYSVSSSPYSNNGAPLSEVGYLLRTWLTVQKIAEVKAAVIDAPPVPPTSPSPADLAVSVSRFATLGWSGAAAGVTFDVYLDTQNPPLAKVVSTLSAAAFTPTLQAGTTYYWKVVATNVTGSTAGPVWTFRTGLTGDINGDAYVNVGDLQILVATWGKTNGEPGYDSRGDLDRNNYINVGDLQLLVTNWGRSL